MTLRDTGHRYTQTDHQDTRKEIEKERELYTEYTRNSYSTTSSNYSEGKQVSRNIFILSMQAANQTYIKYISTFNG